MLAELTILTAVSLGEWLHLPAVRISPKSDAVAYLASVNGSQVLSLELHTDDQGQWVGWEGDLTLWMERIGHEGWSVCNARETTLQIHRGVAVSYSEGRSCDVWEIPEAAIIMPEVDQLKSRCKPPSPYLGEEISEVGDVLF